VFAVRFSENPVPMIVISVPPDAEPDVGETLVISRAILTSPVNEASALPDLI